MRIDSDQWSEIFDSLSRNKLRSFLTAFGIFWGIFMLVLLMGGGRGLESMLGQVFTGFASNAGFVASMNTTKPYKGLKEGRSWSLDLKDIDRVKNCVPEVDVCTGTNNHWGSNAVKGDQSISVSMSGIFPEYYEIDNPRIKVGRRLNDIDVMQNRKVCVVGARIVETLFPGKTDVCGEKIQIDGITYTIVGQSGRSGDAISLNGNPLTSVEIPFTTMCRAYGRNDKIEMLCVTARKGFKMSEVQEKIGTIVRNAHSVHPDDKQAVLFINTEAVFTVMDDLFNGISILVWMIGLGTLLSGAIGVSNIMMVTVKERTTEIGIRRAIGATPIDILQQILSESMTLTLIAGLSGITFSVLILQLVEKIVHSNNDALSNSTFQISFWLAIGASIIIALLGVAAGLGPAFRAMKIKPVDAMREE